jgi:hypothetical protein
MAEATIFIFPFLCFLLLASVHTKEGDLRVRFFLFFVLLLKFIFFTRRATETRRKIR